MAEDQYRRNQLDYVAAGQEADQPFSMKIKGMGFLETKWLQVSADELAVLADLFYNNDQGET